MKSKVPNTQAEPETEPSESQAPTAFLASIYEGFKKARPLSFFRQWRSEDLLASGIPRDWLEKNSLLRSNDHPANLPPYVSQRQLAKTLTRTFGREVSYKEISRLVNDGRKAGGTGLAAFDRGDNRNTLHTAQCVQWWRENRAMGGASAISKTEESKARREAAEARMAEIELERIEKKHSDQWMLTTVALFIMDSFGVTLKNLLRDAFERQLPQRIEDVVKECVADEVTRQNLMEKLRPIFPAKFDQIQADMASKLDEITREAEEMNQRQKAEL